MPVGSPRLCGLARAKIPKVDVDVETPGRKGKVLAAVAFPELARAAKATLAVRPAAEILLSRVERACSAASLTCKYALSRAPAAQPAARWIPAELELIERTQRGWEELLRAHNRSAAAAAAAPPLSLVVELGALASPGGQQALLHSTA